MNFLLYPDKAAWAVLAERPAEDWTRLETVVKEIFAEVQTRGNDACLEYTQRFDGVQLQQMLVTDEEFSEAEKLVPQVLQDAITKAAESIDAFHRVQREPVCMVETVPGVRCWRQSMPIDSVGLYVPGGSAPLFSTVLMLAIPAAIAGCRSVVMCTPPTASGAVHPAVLYAARIAGVHRVFKIGGAQAIAAMSLGTQSIPAVRKIFGPGNQYVTAAKQYAASLHTAIDIPAGPSELLVVADNHAIPAFVAADLLSQAEHGADSHVVFLSWQREIAERVQAEVARQVESLPRRSIAHRALARSVALVLRTKEEAVAFVNLYAPEHLSLAVEDNNFFLERVVNAGSVFIGAYTPEAAGDYASGTNHTLPTGGWAASTGGVSLDSFVKKVTYQQISREGLKKLASIIETMATYEGLEAHRRAVSIRVAHEQNGGTGG